MASRYNSPPNWPSPPPGWVPPPNWQPDPSWGPPPHGHRFWVDDQPQTPQPSPQPTFVPGQPAGQPSGSPYAPGPAKSSGSRAWVIAAAALAVAIIGVVGAIVVISSGGDDKTTATDPSETADTVPSTPVETTSAPVDPTESATSTTSTDSGPAILVLGQSGTVGDYQVALVAITQNANDIVARTNQFNDEPKGQYVIARVSVTYTGSKEGSVASDLTSTFVGSNARQYADYDSFAVVPHSKYDTPTLENGGKASFQVVFDVPPSAIVGATFFVKDFTDFTPDADRVVWSVE